MVWLNCCAKVGQFESRELNGYCIFIFSFLVTFLPETAHHKLPDTIAEGESMGQGDTLYSAISKACRKRKSKSNQNGVETTPI